MITAGGPGNSAKVPDEAGGCFAAGLLTLLGLGLIGLFFETRQLPITPYPNVSGILASIAFTLLGALALIILYRLRHPLRWIMVLVLAAIFGGLVGWRLVLPAVQATIQWLFTTN